MIKRKPKVYFTYMNTIYIFIYTFTYMNTIYLIINYYILILFHLLTYLIHSYHHQYLTGNDAMHMYLYHYS